MHDTKRSLSPLLLCTTMGLLASPAWAHDGPHQMTSLQGVLHQLAHADHLGAALAVAAVAAVGAAAIVRLRLRRTARSPL